MNKKRLIITALIIVSFVCGYLISLILPKQEGVVDVFGVYSFERSSISIKHDATYQFTYPFTEGEIIKIDEKTYKLENGNLDECIIIFSKDRLKLIDVKNSTVQEFNKISSSEGELKEDN